MHAKLFSIQIFPIFASNSAEGLHFSAFHYNNTVLMQKRSALRVSKHVTESIRNIARGVGIKLKMAAPAEAIEKRSNFRIRQF